MKDVRERHNGGVSGGKTTERKGENSSVKGDTVNPRRTYLFSA
jgi:hypothetical protein